MERKDNAFLDLHPCAGLASSATPVMDSYAYPPRGLSREEAARYVGVGRTLFDRLVQDSRMPKPMRLGKRVIWDRLKLDAAFSELGEQTENVLDRALGMGPYRDQEHWTLVAQERGALLDRGIDPDTGAPLRRGRRRR